MICNITAPLPLHHDHHCTAIKGGHFDDVRTAFPMNQSKPVFAKNAPIKELMTKMSSQAEFTRSRRLSAHNNIALELQKMLDTENCLQNHIKMPKQPNFFYSQISAFLKEALAKFYFSTTFGLCFLISSVAPTRASTFSHFSSLRAIVYLFVRYVA